MRSWFSELDLDNRQVGLIAGQLEPYWQPTKEKGPAPGAALATTLEDLCEQKSFSYGMENSIPVQNQFPQRPDETSGNS